MVIRKRSLKAHRPSRVAGEVDRYHLQRLRAENVEQYALLVSMGFVLFEEDTPPLPHPPAGCSPDPAGPLHPPCTSQDCPSCPRRPPGRPADLGD